MSPVKKETLFLDSDLQGVSVRLMGMDSLDSVSAECKRITLFVTLCLHSRSEEKWVYCKRKEFAPRAKRGLL